MDRQRTSQSDMYRVAPCSGKTQSKTHGVKQNLLPWIFMYLRSIQGLPVAAKGVLQQLGQNRISVWHHNLLLSHWQVRQCLRIASMVGCAIFRYANPSFSRGGMKAINLRTEMTLPRALRDLLMLAPSLSRSPVAPELSALSDPAKSTRFMTELFFVSPDSFLVIWSKTMVTTVCARLLVAFMFVEARVLLAVPACEGSGKMECTENVHNSRTSLAQSSVFAAPLLLYWKTVNGHKESDSKNWTLPCSIRFSISL